WEATASPDWGGPRHCSSSTPTGCPPGSHRYASVHEVRPGDPAWTLERRACRLGTAGNTVNDDQGAIAMADDAKQAWNDVGERFASLGNRLSDKYRESGSGGEPGAAETQRKLQ